jgi:hypothetical protein
MMSHCSKKWMSHCGTRWNIKKIWWNFKNNEVTIAQTLQFSFPCIIILVGHSTLTQTIVDQHLLGGRAASVDYYYTNIMVPVGLVYFKWPALLKHLHIHARLEHQFNTTYFVINYCILYRQIKKHGMTTKACDGGSPLNKAFQKFLGPCSFFLFWLFEWDVPYLI